MNIFLVGPMGVGKSTVGRMLANDLAFAFYDTDKVIEERAGVNIPWIFEVEGEQGFRERESNVLKELGMLDACVIATGGGMVVRPENRDLLRRRGLVVYLHATLDQLLERTSKDKNRPLLQADNPREVMQQLLKQREELYASCAHFTVSTERNNPRSVMRKIANHVKYNHTL